MGADALAGGFSDPAIDAAQVFRAALNAMARPGTIAEAALANPPAPLSQAAGSLLLMLCDGETHVHLAGAHRSPEVKDWIAFHSGASIAPKEDAAFAVGDWDSLLPLEDYSQGTFEYPDRSATLIVELPTIRAKGASITGPGIDGEAQLDLPDPTLLAGNAEQFPLGLDFYFTAGKHLAALPRSARVRAGGEFPA